MQLGGQAALVTGATGGIGNAIARALHERGARVLLSGRRKDALDELAASLGDRADVLVADLADREAPTRLAEAAGAVDVLVANAALPASGRVEDFGHDESDRALDVNLRAPIQLTRALLPGMLERGRGHVVFVSSLSGKAASPRSNARISPNKDGWKKGIFQTGSIRIRSAKQNTARFWRISIAYRTTFLPPPRATDCCELFRSLSLRRCLPPGGP